jgi:hypothetical protein
LRQIPLGLSNTQHASGGLTFPTYRPFGLGPPAREIGGHPPKRKSPANATKQRLPLALIPKALF